VIVPIQVANKSYLAGVVIDLLFKWLVNRYIELKSYHGLLWGKSQTLVRMTSVLIVGPFGHHIALVFAFMWARHIPQMVGRSVRPRGSMY